MVQVIDEAPDTVTLRLRLVDARPFVPGQYYNVRRPVRGRPRPVQRAYSVASAPVPDPATIDLGVKEVAGGLISPGLARTLEAGSRLEVRGPAGRFVWDGQPEPVLLVGAGSGVVPLMSMVRYAAVTGRTARIWLICSAITLDHALYRNELDELAAQHPWLRLVHCVTRDPAERRAAYHRRIDSEILGEVLDGEQPAAAYLCGPPPMVDAVSAALTALGTPAGRIRTESYD